MAATMVNGSAGTDANSVSNSMSTPGKQPPKQSFANKVADGNRKQNGPVNDGAPRRAPQKAWQSGMNPLTQRSTTPAYQNGNATQGKGTTSKPTLNHDAGAPEKYFNDRLISLYANAIGLPATVTMKSGDSFKGIFFAVTMDGPGSTYLLKMVQQVKHGVKNDSNGISESSWDYIGAGEDYAMTFSLAEVVDLAVEGVLMNTQNKTHNGSSTGFRTDADISGNLVVRERDLQRWEPNTAVNADMSLEPSGGTWDQFQANEQLFGVKTDYDEDIYTTRIDRSTPDYRQREAEAQRIAQEIEGSSANNSHIREERGLTNEDDGLDEETKYSEVTRQTQEYPPLQASQNNRYMPPARRLPTSKATVPGAPVDPAIIASQVARTDNIQQAVPVSSPAQSRNEAQPLSGTRNSSTEQSKAVTKVSLPTDEASATNRRPSNAAKGAIPSDSATANVEANLLDSFRNFANIEKMRVSDHRRQRISQDKNVKLNDLMKFSQNFKLHTPVPKDLVPILAKDKSKQEEIMEKAQRNAQLQSSASTKATSTTSEQTQLKAVPEGPRETSQSMAKSGDLQETSHPLQGFSSQSPQAGPSRDRLQQTQNLALNSPKPGQGLLSHRLQDSHKQHKSGIPVSVPNPLPIQSVSRPSTRAPSNIAPISTSQTPNSNHTPTSAMSSSRFNIKAAEFKPNPAANSFKPGPSAISSPTSTPGARPTSRAPSPSAFFGDRKPLPAAERPSILDSFNPIKRLKENAIKEGKAKDYSPNNGIKYAFTTTPAWTDFNDENDQRSYKDMFEGPTPISGKVSPQPAHQINHSVPHQHQLPHHLQQSSNGTPHLQAPPQQAPFSTQPQLQQYPAVQHHYDDQRMHLSASNQPMFPSPRMQNNSMAYPSPMQQPAQLAFSQPMPQYLVNMNGSQTAHLRQFPGAPQMMPAQGPQLAAPMMIQQSSQGGFVGPPQGMPVPFNPQMPMYPPGQAPSYGAQSQPPSGYPSPGRAAPMMVHQGSQQGQQHMYMNPGQYSQPVYAQQPGHMTPMQPYASPRPHYAQSPQPQYYPPQPHRVPSNSYGQPPHGPHQHQHQHMHHGPPNHSIDHSEDMK